MLKRLLSLAIIFTLLSSICIIPVSFADGKYTDPILKVIESTYIRRNFGDANYSESGVVVVDPSYGNYRISFLRFSGAEYKDFVDEATNITLSLSPKREAGDESAESKFSVVPISGAFKEIDLSALTFNTAKDIYDGEISLVDYNPEYAIEQNAVYGVTNEIDVTDYCKAQTDGDYLFMIRPINGAYPFNYSVGGNDITLSVTSNYTPIANDAAKTAEDIYNKYGNLPVSDKINLVHEYNGFDISYKSRNPEYISDSGEVIRRPTLAEGDKKCLIDVSVTHAEHPNLNEKALIEVAVLSDGKYVSDIEERSGNLAFKFSGLTSVSNQRQILDIPLSGILYGENTLLKFGEQTVAHFPENSTASDLILDVTDVLATNPNAEFIISGDSLKANSSFAPILFDINFEPADAVLKLANYDFGDLNNVRSNLNLPFSFGNYSVSWTSSEKAFISDNGRVNRGDSDKTLRLDAYLSGDGFCFSMSFGATVIRTDTDTADGKYPLLHDPMTMSDEKLFGEWNKSEGKWDTEPILRYDKFKSELSGVLSAVKDGNYENAKSELLAYYRLKDEDEKYTYEASKTYNISADAMNDKIWTYSDNDGLLGQAYIEDEWDWYSVDLTGGSNRRGTYYLVDSDMDGSYLEIASKENSNGLGAYFEVTINGVKSVIPVNADTYISAGDNIDTNYGTDEILYCREAAGGPTLPIGTNTQRPYFKFDLGRISRTAKATSVKLNFYGRAVGSERKKVYCFTTNNNKDFDENEFTWKEIYPQVFNFKETGFLWLPVSDHENIWHTEYEWLNYSTRYYQVMWLMQAYLLNKNEEYVYRSLEFAMSQLSQQPSCTYPRALDSGWRIQNIIRLMYTAIDSEFMTPEIFTALLKYAYGHIDALKDVTLGATNQDSAVKVNVARICAFLPEITKDEWWDKAKNNLYRFYSSKLLNKDGSYTESCTNYISGVINEFIDAAEMIKARDGEDSELYKFFIDQLKKLVTYYMNLGYSNRKTVPYGDGGRGDLDGSIKKYNELLNDNDLRYFASMGEEGKEPDYTSALYPAKAVCMMRSGWHEDDLCAFLNNDNGGTHGHCDELALDVLAFGKYLLVDAGVSSYSEGSEFAQTRHKTLYHNTIEIDDKDQNHAGSNIPGYMDFRSNASFDFLHAATDMAYDGFSMNRKVLMLKNKYIIVSDFINVTDSEPHTYRLLWHPDRNNNLALDPATGMAYTSYDNQPNIKIVPSDSSAKPKLFNRLMNQPGYGEASSRSVQYNKENAVGDQYFDTVLYPENTGSDDMVTVSRITLDSNDPTFATALEVKINDNTGYYYSSNAENTSAAKFGKYIYDGRMAYVETNEDGKLSYIALTDGNSLKDINNNDIIKSSASLTNLSAAFESSALKLFSSDEIKSDISIASPREYNTVYLNGKEVDFEYKNGYITTDGTEKKSESGGSIKPGSPSGAGGFGGGGGGTTPAVPVDPTDPTTPDKKDFPFKDCENHWAREYIERLYNDGIVSGMTEDSFAPDVQLTRAQAAKLIVSACKTDKAGVGAEIFTDVTSDDWYAAYVSAAYKAGFVNGYEDGSFKPNANVTRQELAKMICKAADYIGMASASKDKFSYADESEISTWAIEYVQKAYELGLMSGDEKGRFNPNSNATRAEMSAVICRLTDAGAKKGEVKNQ